MVERLPSMQDAFGFCPQHHEDGVVMQPCNPSTEEMEAGGLEVQIRVLGLVASTVPAKLFASPDFGEF